MSSLPNTSHYLLSGNNREIHFKSKILFKNNKINLRDMTSSSEPFNLNHLLRLASSDAQFNKPGGLQPLPEFDLNIGAKGGEYVDHQKGYLRQKKIHFDIISKASIWRDPVKRNLLNINVTSTSNQEFEKDDGTKKKISVTTSVNLHMNIDVSAPEGWTEQELDAVFLSHKKYPFAPAETEAVLYVVENLLGGKVAAFQKVFDYGMIKYGISLPYPATIDPSKNDSGTYNWLTNNLSIHRGAYTNNIHYLVSAYIHEYTHVLQDSEGATVELWSKFKKETEAYCIQLSWIDNNKEHPGDLSLSKKTLRDRLHTNFKVQVGSGGAMNCSGDFPRSHIVAKINSLNGSVMKQSRDIANRNNTGVSNDDQEVWQMIVE